MNLVSEQLVAGMRGTLTSHARFATLPTSLDAGEGSDSSNVPSMPTTCS